jgi:beta-glucosidase/6-phospho-beta-glucosidase/beta-galactosidase
MYYALRDLKKYQVPIYVTENGLADGEDRQRLWFIRETLKNVHRAISEGVDVRGYLHWSLMDNFEWDKGLWPRFGLIAIDYATQKRTARPSSVVYKKFCQDNGFEE